MATRAQPISHERAEPQVGGIARPVLYVAAVLLCLVFVTPFFWTISISLKQISRRPTGWLTWSRCVRLRSCSWRFGSPNTTPRRSAK